MSFEFGSLIPEEQRYKLPSNFIYFENKLLYANILHMFNKLNLFYKPSIKYDKQKQIIELRYNYEEITDNTFNLYIVRFKVENNKIITIETINKKNINFKFSIPILALSLCILLISYDFSYLRLFSSPGKKRGLDYCLICYYQKFGFQPVGTTYETDSFIRDFKNAQKVAKSLGETYVPQNISSCQMIVDRQTLEETVYNMIKNNDICKTYLKL